MPSVAQLSVVVNADTKNAEAGLASVNDKVDKSKGFFDSALGHVLAFATGGLAVAGVAGAFGMVKDAVTDWINAGIQAQQTQAQTVAVLKSTGDVSGQTAQSIEDLADSYSRTTVFSADTVQQTENLLLTFDNLKGNVFPQATQAVLNVAQAMHEGPQQAAIQLGKALNDPATGMSQLQRIGVTFTQQQKDQAKAMEAAGNMAGAQKIVLDELSKEFGGSAVAAGQTFGGALQIAQNQLELAKEKVGEALIPVLGRLVTAVTPVVTTLADALPGALSLVTGVFNSTLLPVLNGLTPILQTGAHLLQGLFGSMDKGKGAVSNLSAVVSPLTTIFTKVAPTVEHVADIIGTNLAPVLQHLGTFISGTVVPIISTLVSVFETDIEPTISAVADTVANDLMPPLSALANQAIDLGQTILPVISPILQGIGDTFKDVVGPAIQIVVGVVGKVLGAFSGFIGFLSSHKAILIGVGAALAAVGAIILASLIPPLIAAAAAFVTTTVPAMIVQATTTLTALVPSFLAWAAGAGAAALATLAAAAPVLAIIAGVALLVAGIVLLVKHWNDVVAVLTIVKNAIGTVVHDAIGGLVSALDWVGGKFNDFWNVIKSVAGWIGGVFTDTINGISTLFSNVFNGLVSFVKAPFNLIIDGLNVLIGGLDAIQIDVPGWVPVIGGDKFGFQIPNIPHMAQGGTVTTQGIVEVGENGPETLVLPRGAQVIPGVSPAALSTAAQGGGTVSGAGGAGANGATQVIQVLLDGRVLAETTLKNLPRAVRLATGMKI